MDVVVVAVAEQYEVFEFGEAEVSPVVDVVGVAPGDVAVASGVAAAAVACGDSAEQIGGHGACRSPVGDDRVPGADDAV